jgi:hypothetical protein
VCSLCGVFRNEHWADEGGGRRRLVLRVSVLQRLLATAGLSLREWAGQYVVADAKGRSEVVEDLPGLWVVVERLTGRPLDPLDPTVVAAMTEQAL